MPALPTITAEVVFLPREEGGRAQLPEFGTTSYYMPHLVVQSRDVRRVVIDADGVGREDYLGVAFVECRARLKYGEAARVELELMYHPSVSYEALQPGATFTVREGGRIVAHGVVLSRGDPNS